MNNKKNNKKNNKNVNEEAEELLKTAISETKSNF